MVVNYKIKANIIDLIYFLTQNDVLKYLSPLANITKNFRG